MYSIDLVVRASGISEMNYVTGAAGSCTMDTAKHVGVRDMTRNRTREFVLGLLKTMRE